MNKHLLFCVFSIHWHLLNNVLTGFRWCNNWYGKFLYHDFDCFEPPYSSEPEVSTRSLHSHHCYPSTAAYGRCPHHSKSCESVHIWYKVVQSLESETPFTINVFIFQRGYDVFIALDVMRNKEFLEPLKFTQGDNTTHYYLYNWTCPNITPDKVTTVLQISVWWISHGAYILQL